VFAWRRQYQRGLLKPRNRALTPVQLSMRLEGISWRRPLRTAAPQMAV
jgi:hypothetical protein